MRGGKKGKHCGSWLEFQMEDLPDVPGCNTHLHAVAQCEQCVCKKADWLEVSVRTDHMELWGGVHHQICGLKICPFERSRMQTLRCSTNGFTAQKKQTWQISFEENWHANALKNRNTGSSSVNTHTLTMQHAEQWEPKPARLFLDGLRPEISSAPSECECRFTRSHCRRDKASPSRLFPVSRYYTCLPDSSSTLANTSAAAALSADLCHKSQHAARWKGWFTQESTFYTDNTLPSSWSSDTRRKGLDSFVW